MKNFIAFLLFSFISFAAYAQNFFSISGKIIDQDTKLPLQGASVFAENTTIGTATDAEGVFHLRLPNGGYSLAITFTGYQTETKRITSSDADNNNLVIDLKKKEKSMDEFVVKASYEVADGLAKYGNFFIENFIGKTANAQQCSIENKEALKFYYYKRKNRLKILATEPLRIVNNALGYTIKYELDSFVHEYNTDISLYSGYPLFKEMETSSLQQLEKWNAARTVAYNGSILHFMRSMYQKKLEEEGFEIQFLVKKNDNETAIPLKDFYRSVNYKKDDSTNTVDILPNQQDVAIIYKNEEPSDLYREANPDAPGKFELSVLNFLPNESLDIEQNGFYYEQNDITITGYWAWEKIGDMLPYNFRQKENTSAGEKPDTVAHTQSVTTHADTAVNKNETTLPATTQSKEPANLLTNTGWKMEESTVIEGKNMKYYKRGRNENTINFDNDIYKFENDNTGTYFFNGQPYKFNWKYLDAGKTKIEMAIQYPTPLIVTLENILITENSLKYTRLQNINGITYVAIETRVNN